ncbi:hypothetical protein PSPO01_15326 [Paraphaeosphaeria sporulosa]
MEGITPPPDLLYGSYEEAYDALKTHGIQHGYGFVLKRSWPHNSIAKTRYYYHCDRFRSNFQSTAKVLSTSTRSTGCPFRLVVFKMKVSGQWKLEVQDRRHNHPRSINPSAHNVYRKRTSAQKEAIELMTHAGVRPMQILAAIQKEDQDTLVSATDIRSERKAIREKHLNGRSSIETLLDDLSTRDWIFAVKKDDHNRLVYAKRPLEFQLKWNDLIKDYIHQQELCRYLQENQYLTRTEWAAAWTSNHRHYNTITSSPVERMHKMVKSQHNKYRKDLASSKHSVKFEHRLAAMPFLPPGIHDILTPPAIERIRQQDLLRQQEQRQRRGGHPCSGLFEKINGLPCRHTLQEVVTARSTLRLNHLYDDHWRYQREQGPSVRLSPRPYHSILEPLPAQTRGGPRRNEASTRRDPSAFERRVPPSSSQFQPSYEPQNLTLAEVLRQVSTSVTVSAPTSVVNAGPVTTCISLSIPAPAPTPSVVYPRSSPPMAVAVSVTVASPPAWRAPSLQEFLADIENRRSQAVMYQYNDMFAANNFLVETGQEDDPVELVEARNMALATEGLFASCTPTMAWNYHFGDMEAFYAERFAQVDAQNALLEPQRALTEPRDEPVQRPKRAAAIAAPDTWKTLSPRKRHRRQ